MRGATLGLFLLVAAAMPMTRGQAQAPSQAPRPERPAAERMRLENDVRRGFARLVRQHVGLSDDQMQRLGPITREHEMQRMRLQAQEREVRLALQRAIRESQDGEVVERLLAQMIQLQKQRVEILESEQRMLATVMTPLQRAKYMAVQEQIRRRMEQMRMRAAQDGAAGRRGGARPPL